MIPTRLYKYNDLWWYDTPEGEMCCPPFVRTIGEARAFLGLEEWVNRPGPIYKATRVDAFTPDGQFVKRWPTIRAAATEVGCAPCSISNATRYGGLVRGYRWVKVESVIMKKDGTIEPSNKKYE